MNSVRLKTAPTGYNKSNNNAFLLIVDSVITFTQNSVRLKTAPTDGWTRCEKHPTKNTPPTDGWTRCEKHPTKNTAPTDGWTRCEKHPSKNTPPTDGCTELGARNTQAKTPHLSGPGRKCLFIYRFHSNYHLDRDNSGTNASV